MKTEEETPLASMETLASIIESIVFVSGEAIAVKDIAEKLDVTDKQVLDAAKKLQAKYDESSGINLLVFNKKLQFSSNPKNADDVAAVLNPIRERALSKTLLESAAIIAYKQPVTRLDLEEIRGVDSEYAIQTLLKLGIIEVVGRKDAIGRPVLFGTTDEFLKRFQISSLDELPDYDSLLSAIKIDKKDSYLFTKDTYDESKDPELMGAADDNKAPGNNQTAIDEALNSASHNNGGEEIAATLANDLKDVDPDEKAADEDFDLDDLDEEIPDFLVGEDIEKVE